MTVYKVPQHERHNTNSVQQSHTVFVPSSTPREALLNPASWVHVARFLHVDDEVRVLAKNRSWYAKYLVVDRDDFGAQLHELSFHPLNPKAEVMLETQSHRIEDVENVGWVIVRKADGQRMNRTFHSAETAFRWLTHITKQKAA